MPEAKVNTEPDKQSNSEAPKATTKPAPAPEPAKKKAPDHVRALVRMLHAAATPDEHPLYGYSGVTLTFGDLRGLVE